MILWCVHDYQAVLSLFWSDWLSWVCTIVIPLHNARTVTYSVQIDDSDNRISSCNKRCKSCTTKCFTGLFLFEYLFSSVENYNEFSLSLKRKKTCINVLLKSKMFIRCLNTCLYMICIRYGLSSPIFLKIKQCFLPFYFENTIEPFWRTSSWIVLYMYMLTRIIHFCKKKSEWILKLYDFFLSIIYKIY